MWTLNFMAHFHTKCHFKQSGKVGPLGESGGGLSGGGDGNPGLSLTSPLPFIPEMHQNASIAGALAASGFSPCHPSFLAGHSTLRLCPWGCFPWLGSPSLAWLAGCPQNHACPRSAVPAEVAALGKRGSLRMTSGRRGFLTLSGLHVWPV